MKQETLDQLNKIEAARKADGIGATEACKRFGVSVSNYYNWRKLARRDRVPKRKHGKPYLKEIPVASAPQSMLRVIVLSGDPAEIARVLEGMK
jgi:transposase-like protein